MSTRIFTRAKNFISLLFLIIGAVMFASSVSRAEWKFDFSHHLKSSSHQMPGQRSPASLTSFIGSIFNSSEPTQELVILNTAKGFVPSVIHVRRGGLYRIHVVNVNEHDKNVSFIMDAFSEHHATYFAKIKTFEIHPEHDGIFRFESPETGAQGRLVVLPPAQQDGTPETTTPIRMPASE